MTHWFARGPKLILGTTGPPLLGGRLILDQASINTHKHLMGVTGQGKSKLLASIFIQLVSQGIGAALIDPHSDLALDVLALLHDRGFFKDDAAYRRLLYVDFSRRDRFLPFNVLSQPYDAHTVARNTVEVCKRAWPALADGSAPQFENILLASVVVLVENQLPITDMPRLLTDHSFRNALLTHVTDPYVVDFFHARFDRWGKEAPLMIESTLRRVFLLTFSPTLRYSLGQKENRLNFRQLMDDGVSVIYNLGGLDEETQRFIGCLLTVGHEVAALSRADVPESSRRPYHLIIDEFSQFSAQSEEALARILSLMRKYKLFACLSHQTWSQISENLRGGLQNCLEIAFKLGRSDAEWAASRFGQFDPFLVKSEVADPNYVDRTHPVYFALHEQLEAMAQQLEGLRRREAYVRANGRTVKIKTQRLPTARCSADDFAETTNRYARELLRPARLIPGNALQSAGASRGELVFRKTPGKP